MARKTVKELTRDEAFALADEIARDIVANRALIENYGDAAASRPAVEDGGGEEDSSALDFLKRLSHV